MATLPMPERAVVRQTHPSPHAEHELFLAIRAPQTSIQGRWLLEVVKLFLDKLPPAQPPLPGILPQFNLGTPLQSLLSPPAPAGIIPHRGITSVEEGYPRTSSTHDVFDSNTPQPPSRFRAFATPFRPAFPPIGPIYERHNRRLADLKNLLGPLTCQNDSSGDDDSGCVLLCWGGSSSCRVLAVNHIGGSIDQEVFWKKLQRAWYDTRGRWRQKMPWYGIRSVKQVEIRLVSPDPNAKDLFLGVYQPADKALETWKQKLRESMSTFSHDPEPEIDDGRDHISDGCYYDFGKGFTTHNLWDCIGYSDPDGGTPTCPVEEFYENEKRLARLMMEPLRTLLFQNPKMAVYNELENAVLVHSSKSIRGQYEWQHCASLGQLVFRGLHIEDGWTFDATIVAIFMPLASVVSISIVVMAWLTYGDWGVAWNVGACFIPLLTGLWSWLLHSGTSG
ncbi:hypothetical protein DL98DRAFT_540678 [Cadophora sp. DSE1049]|nr:hypothetical protein DL98DRAFT_540678 [Cadophora sp. DSE1049]